jgi:hypothetical protein
VGGKMRRVRPPGRERRRGVSVNFPGVKPLTLTEAPVTIKGVEVLISKEDAKYPEGPACNVRNRAQHPVKARTRNSGGFRIRELCNYTNIPS